MGEIAGALSRAVFDSVQRFAGGSIAELKEKGAENYPSTPPGSQHHAQAAEDVTRRMAPYLTPAGAVAATQGAGALLELYEATQGSKLRSKDTREDFKANLIGALRGAQGGSQSAAARIAKEKLRRRKLRENSVNPSSFIRG